MMSISLPRKLDAIVHIGAGHGVDAENWLDAGTARIVLVEPDPVLLADLRRRYASEGRVEIIDAAIAGKNGPATLRLYNHAGANSLRASKRIFETHPDLKLREMRKMDAISVNDFIRGLSLKTGARNALIVEAPGEEGAIITALASIDLIRSFSNIRVAAEAEAIYGEWKSAETIAELLAGAGFDAGVMTDDRRRPLAHGDRNPMIDALEEALKAAKSREEALQKADAAAHEAKHRNALLAQELARLEGQLELIKDVLIRDRLD